MMPQQISPSGDWLVVVDAQEIFASPEKSPWGSPMWEDTVSRIRDAAESYGDKVVLTRFVADPQPRGCWVEYYQQYSFAQVPADDPLYALVPELAELADRGVPVISEPTFGKWTSALTDIVGSTPRLMLAGVATDCCVLSTALAAADGGATVRVGSELCAGSSLDNHARALAAMALYAPQITVA
jgi:nicotinamidase-related amidase